MLKNDRLYSNTISSVTGIILIAIGTLIILFNKNLYFKLINILILVAIVNGFFAILKCVFNEKERAKLLKALMNFTFALVLLMIPSIPQSIFPILLASYLVGYSLIKGFMYILYRVNHVDGEYKELVSAIILLIMGFIILLFPLNHLELLLILVGTYFVLYGIYLLFTVIYSLIPAKHKNILKRKIRITLPVLVEMVVPYIVFVGINKALKIEDENKNNKKIKPTTNVDMEILVHVSNNGFNRVGHVDLIYNGNVISYGNYDDDSHKYMDTIGDGVLFKTKKEEYIKFCIKHSKKILFGFGIQLTETQKKAIDKKITKLNEEVIPWEPPVKRKGAKKSMCKDYASELYKATKAEFYKFNDGKFKTYFVFNVSCCDLANEIIGYSGIDFLKMNGIITPGTYYDCLNREFINQTGLVTFRNIYTKDTCKYLFKKS